MKFSTGVLAYNVQKNANISNEKQQLIQECLSHMITWRDS